MKAKGRNSRRRRGRGILYRFGGDGLNRVIKLQEQSLTMTLVGKKEEKSCPDDKRKELCVLMA